MYFLLVTVFLYHWPSTFADRLGGIGTMNAEIFPKILVVALSLAFTAPPAAAALAPAINHASRDFESIDLQASRVSAQGLSVASLARNLAALGSTDAEKARAIFTWIAHNVSYDTHSFLAGSSVSGKPEDVLRSGRAVCQGFAAVFQALATEAGLKSVVVEGYSKGYHYQTGARITGPPDHAWNAVLIDGQYKLLDCTWGAGYMDSEKRFVRRFQERYFFTRPEEFIFDHFPVDPRWQLLDPPVSREDYENRVVLRPAFFNHGLKIESHLSSVVTVDGQTELTLITPRGVAVLPMLKRDGEKLARNFVFSQRDGDRIRVSVRPPEAGRYQLQIFTRAAEDSGSFEIAAEYVLLAARPSDTPGFPESYEPFLTRDVRLLTPLEGELPAGKPVEFRMELSDADSVAVITDGKFEYLQKSGSVWKGVVAPKPGSLRIGAKFPGENQFQILLAYNAR